MPPMKTTTTSIPAPPRADFRGGSHASLRSERARPANIPENIPASLAPGRDAAAAEPADGDLLAELFQIVEQAGGTIRFYGAPITEQQLRGVAERHGKDRLLAAVAPPLAPGQQVEEHW